MYIDLLTKIKNAEAADKKVMKTRFSNTDKAVADLLERYKFLKKVEVKGRLPKRIIELEFNPDRPVQGVRLLSRPSRRLYAGYKDFKRVKGGQGFLFISTPKGILTDREARKEKVGGELLFEIW